MPTRLALMRDQVRYQPGSADAVFELAYEYFRLRNYNDAAIGFKRVLLTRPNDVEALNNYAVALYRTRRGDLARESLRRAGDLAAGHAVVQRNLGVVLDSQGRVADAVVAYAKAAKAAHEERKPKIESRARDARGYCLERLEKLDDAAREYDLAYELDGDNFQAKEDQALGQALLRRRHLEGLCKQLGKAKIEDLPRSDDEKTQDALDARTLDPRALRLEAPAVADARLFHKRLRRRPAKRTDGRGSVRHTHVLEGADRRVPCTSQASGRRLDDESFIGRSCCCSCREEQQLLSLIHI